MAEKRTIDINIKNNAGEAEKDFKSFNKAMDETTKSAKNLDATFEEVYGDLQPLTTRMGEAEDRLYELALAGDTASKEYQELLEKVGNYRKVQIQTDLAVDGAATTMGQKLGSALTGATSGFAATQGAMAVFGSESEKLEQTLVKVQGALAIQQGVQGLATSYRELGGKTGLATKAQAAFNFVMNLNPIILIATAIAAAIAALVAFTDVLDPVIDKMKKLTDLIGITNFEEKKLAEQRKKRVAERDKQLKQQINNLVKEREEIQKTLDLENRRRDAQIERLKLQQEVATSQEEQRKLGEQIRKETLDGIQKELDAHIKTEKTNIQIRNKAYERLAAQSKVRRLTDKEKEYLVLLKKENAKRNRELVEQDNVFYQEINNRRLEVANERELEERARRKESNERWKAWAKERLDAERLIQDLEISLMEEGIEKELEIERVKFARLNEDLKGTAEEKKRLRELYEKQEQQAVSKIREKFRKEEAAKELQFLKDNRLPFLKAQADEEVKIEVNKYSVMAQAQAEFYKEQKRLDEEAAERRNLQIDLTIQGFQLVAGIAEAFAGEDEKRQKRAFQIKKAADIASATVDGYRAVLSTYAQTPGGVVLKTIAATIAGGFAALQIANIAKQEFQGGADGSSVASSASAGGGDVVSPEFNVVGDTGVNQLAQIQQQPTQAFVVSGEVTSAQALDRNRVTNATL